MCALLVVWHDHYHPGVVIPCEHELSCNACIGRGMTADNTEQTQQQLLEAACTLSWCLWLRWSLENISDYMESADQCFLLT